MADIYGDLISAAFEKLSADPSGTGNVKGRAYVHSTDNLVKWYNGSVWKTLVETDTAQALTNKDIDGGTASNTSRLTLPKAAYSTLTGLTRKAGTLLFDTTSNRPYYDDGTNLKLVGSGSGGGSGVNYIANPDGEGGTTGWTAFADAAAATPVDMTGGSPNSTFTTSTSSPLRGAQSFLWTKSGSASRQGEGFSYTFTADSADLSKVMQISFDVDATDANYTDSELTVWVRDNTNGTLIYPAFQGIKKAKYTFQTTFVATTGTSYTFGVYTSGTSTANYTIKFDNFQVGPVLANLGVPVEDLKSYTPTLNSTTNVVLNQAWAGRFGQFLIVKGYVTYNGAGNNSTFTVGLPAGCTFDATVGTSNIGDVFNMGNWQDFGTGNKQAVATYNSTSSVKFIIEGAGSDLNSSSFANNDVFSYLLMIPIAEWAGSAVNLSQAQPEYAYSNGTWDANNTVNFAYGPEGAALGGALTANRTKTVRFFTPVQATDRVELQFSYDRKTWVSANGAVLDTIVVVPSVNSGATAYAGIWSRSGSTAFDVDVTFGRYAVIANDDTPATDWPSANAFWRVAKYPGGVQVASPVTTRFRSKGLLADVTADGVLNDLTFTLIPGKTYRINMHLTGTIHTSDQNVEITVKDGATEIGYSNMGNRDAAGNQGATWSYTKIVTITNGSLTFTLGSLSASGFISASNGRSYVQVEELSTHVTTPAW